MIRRVFAMLLALTFWSIQTADAFVPHGAVAGSAAVAVTTAAGADATADVTICDADQSNRQGPSDPAKVCVEGCPCHALHHAFVALPANTADVIQRGEKFAFAAETRADDVSSKLNKPPRA